MVVLWSFCTKDLSALCPSIFVGHEGADWFEEQGKNSCKKASGGA
jgi:hypothetical protein